MNHEGVKAMMRSGLMLVAVGILTACVAKVPMDKQSFAGKTMQMKATGASAFTYKTFEDFNNDWWSMQTQLDAPANTAQPGSPKPVNPAMQALIQPSDPTQAVVNNVYQVLTSELGLRYVDQPADFLVELHSVTWGMQHHPIALTTYNIFYSAMLRITDQRASSEKPAREWFTCSVKSDSKYGYEEVFASDAAAVSQFMAQAGQSCGQELVNKIRAESASDSN